MIRMFINIKKNELMNVLLYCSVSVPFISFSFTMSSFLSFLHSLVNNETIPVKSYRVKICYANPNNEKLNHGRTVVVNSTVNDTLFDRVLDTIVEDGDIVQFSGLNIKFTIKRIDSQWKIDTFSTWPDYFTD